MIIFYTLVFIYGLLIGSFLNVCIYRIPNGESIVSPPSHCSKCSHRLLPLDLVPVFSYLFLKGKCRYCGVPYSFRYTAVEIINAIVYIILFFKFSSNMIEFAAYALFMSILIAVFFIDYDHKIIPNELVIAGLVLGALLFFYNLFYPLELFVGDRTWWNPLVGMFIGSGFLLAVALLGMLIFRTDEAMGMGDVKLLAPIGLILGWKMTIVALFFSVVVAGMISVVLMIARKKGRRDTIPFGPFIVLGVFFAIMIGHQALDFYLNVIILR